MQCEKENQVCAVTANYEILSVRTGTTLFVVVYRPPDGNFDEFLGYLETIFEFADSRSYTVFMGGDFNVNMNENSSRRKRMLTLLECHFMQSVINLPTRVTPTSATILDLLIVSKSTLLSFAGVIDSSLSDHLPVFAICSNAAQQTNRKTLTQNTIQQINSYTLEKFRNAIIRCDWESVRNYTNAENAFQFFLEKFLLIYKDCFPYKTFIPPKRARKPWVTPYILKMISEKNKLYRKFLKSRNTADFKTFKRHRNKINV